MAIEEMRIQCYSISAISRHIIYITIYLKMPQLIPFYYLNEITFAFLGIVLVLYLVSNYILPGMVRLFISRMFINKI